MQNNGEKKRIVLVVDDQPKVLRFIEIDLKLRGYKVITTTSGEEALKLSRSEVPDVVLLDMVMPEMDGLEVLRRLRDFCKVPVIAFSASHGMMDEAIRLGASDFVNKPFRTEDMIKRIEALLPTR